MSRDKQIEGIVKDFCPLYQEYGSCKRCNKDLNIDEEPCYYGCVANIIIDYGYRKASEVAREIFAEIQERFNKLWEGGKTSMFQCLVKAVNETEKKYTEGGE